MHWYSDQDRPIFFVELHERYVCSWCEMHDGRLILIPAPQSKRRAQHVRYPAEATISGRVTRFAMDLVEPSENEARALTQTIERAQYFRLTDPYTLSGAFPQATIGSVRPLDSATDSIRRMSGSFR